MQKELQEAMAALRKLLKAPDADINDLLEASGFDVHTPKSGPAAIAFWIGYMRGAAEAMDVTPSELVENELG